MCYCIKVTLLHCMFVYIHCTLLSLLVGRGVRRNFEKKFPLQLSDRYIRLPDCSIRVSRSFHQNHNSEQLL